MDGPTRRQVVCRYPAAVAAIRPDDPWGERLCLLVFLLVGLLPILGSPARAATPVVVLGEDVASVSLAGEVQFLEDPTAELRLSDVRDPQVAERFAPASSGSDINFGYSASAYWLRFTLAAENPPRQWLLEVAFPSLDRVELHFPGEAGYERIEVGDLNPFAQRPVVHRNFVFPVGLGPEPRTFYLRVSSSGTLTIPLRVWESSAFALHNQHTYAAMSLYYGMLLALMLYNLLLYVSIRDRNYLTYVLFGASMAVGLLSLNGLGNQYVWPAWPAWGNVALPVGFAATGLFGGLFTRGFLATSRTAPGLDKLIVALLGAFAVSALATLFVSYRAGAILTSLTGLFFALTAVLGGILCLRRGHPGARYFLLAWTLLLVGVGVMAARNLGWLPTNVLTSYAMQAGSAVEMLLLSFALADRINVMRREKELAQVVALRANDAALDVLRASERELEARVASRTRELEAANARLRASEAQLEGRVASRTQELELARRAAEDANNAKSRFLAAASHDLRQPLSALTLYAKVLEPQVAAAGRPLLANMKDSIDSLSELLTDLLDLSKLEAGVVTPHPSDFPVEDALAGLVALHAPEAELKGLRLRRVRSRLVAHTDAVLFRRILGNFIDNAVRYTRTGGVLVGCRRRGGRAWVEVCDTGVGFPEDRTAEIFEEFRQLEDDARTRGSGLGLAIVAKTADLLGLEIRVRSRPGRGSVFGIELPLGMSSPEAARHVVPAVASRALNIALAEDNLMVREALTSALRSLGHEVTAADCGAALRAALGGRRTDIVISDYRLPHGETGFDVISTLRAALGSDLPAILVTGDTDPRIVRNMSARGIIVLHKPLDLDTLQAYIEDLTFRDDANDP